MNAQERLTRRIAREQQRIIDRALGKPKHRCADCEANGANGWSYTGTILDGERSLAALSKGQPPVYLCRHHARLRYPALFAPPAGQEGLTL